MNPRPDNTMVPHRVVQFKNCEVWIWNDDYLETRFPDGKVCPALFKYDSEMRILANQLGYGGDVRQMHLDHELAHTFLAEREGLKWSRCLRAAAERHETGEEWTFDAERSAEEHRVLQFQARLNGIDSERDAFKRFRCL